MTFQKFAEATIIGAEIATRDAFGLVKAAHRAVFDYEPKPGFLYVRSRMISSRANDNHDEFPADEIKASWKTAIGKPAFVNHHNEDHRRMRGVIIDAALHEDVTPDGKPDIWIEALHEVDAKRFPKLAEGIISGRINRTSMGCDVGFSICSACNNKASTPAEYCQHIPRMKGQILYRHTASGRREGEIIREICHKLSFFENSFLVEPPADPTAYVLGVDTRGLNKVASLQKEAIPEGIRFRYEPPEYNKSVDHKLVATLPGRNGEHEEVGHLSWDAHRGMVSMVSTDEAHKNKGIASLLWRRAHEISANRGLTPPRHSDIKTPAGIGWSNAVDKQELPPFAGPGQQELFPVPPESATHEGPEQPRGDSLREHLISDHGFAGGHPHFQRMTDAEAEKKHDEKHRFESPYSRPPWPHVHGSLREPGPGQGELFDLPPGAKKEPAPKPQKAKKPSDGFSLKDGPLSWDEIGERHPALYGDSEYHGEAARHSDGSGIGSAANMLAHDRADDPEAEGSSVHELSFHSEMVHPDYIDNASAGGSDPRVQEAERGYETNPQQVPPLVLVHRHGVYQVADGHHRAEAASRADKKVRAYVAYSPYPDEPFSDGGEAPYHGAEEHPGIAGHRPKTAGLRTLAQVTALQQGQPFQIRPQGNKWLVVDVKGKTRGEHDTEQDAKVHQATLYSSLPEAGDVSGNKNPKSTPDTATEIVRARLGMRKGAPFAGYEDFEDCVDKNEDKRDPDAYCGEIKHKVEGRQRRLPVLADYQVPANCLNCGADMVRPRHAGDERAHEGSPVCSDCLDGEVIEPKEKPSSIYHQETDSGGRRRTRDLIKDVGQGRGRHFGPEHMMPQSYSSLPSVVAEDKHFIEPSSCLNCGRPMMIGKSLKGVMPFKKDESGLCYDCARGHTNQRKPKPAPELYIDAPGRGGRGEADHLMQSVDEGRGRHWTPDDYIKQSQNSLPSVLAYGETKAPAEVDTLRTESCPVCGETDSFDGDRCEVCHFLQPPSMFTDPDTGVAKQMDLKKEPFDQGMKGPNGEPLPDVDSQEAQQEMADMPGTPGDQVADLFCPACGFSADTQEPMTNNDPAMPSGEQGLMEGDVCPQCGQATMLSPNDVGEMGGEVPQEIAGDADADALPDDQESDVDKDGIPDDAEPDVDEDGIPDDAEPDEDQDGVPDDAEEAPEAPEAVPGEEDADPAAVEDEEPPQKGRKDNSRRASWRGHERNEMTKPNQTAGASSELATLRRTVAVLQEQLGVAGRQLHYLATLAGVSSEFDALKREGAKKIADIMNPAQPIPDPPGGAPTETTQQAEAPKTFDDPRNPGLTPGSTDGVPAAMTASPLDPGVTMPTSPYTQLVDPTQPVAGTETHVPLDQTKILTDVHIGDPMVNADNPQGYGFPLTGPFAQDGAASANTTTSPGMQRTMASIRLAKLRKSAGLVSSDVDEMVLGSQIERTASLSNAMIAHEISTLDAVTKSASRAQAGRRPQGGPLPKTAAAAERRAPSLAGGADLSTQASFSSGFDADDASDLFVDALN